MGERAVRALATRERIVEAAIALYTEQGISATTLRQIRERADVAPGTLRHHFPTRDELEQAMIEHLQAEAPLPAISIYDGARSLEERLSRLIRVTGTFLDQAARMYRMWLREPMLSGPWAEAGAAYGERWDALMRLALGPLADDDESMAVLRTVLQPTFFGGIRAATRTSDEVAGIVAALVTPWFTTRSAERSGRGHRVVGERGTSG
jgi:AcrR family transcriptional regulator